MKLGLDNRTIIVTGGASGIGAACAALLSEEGALPVTWDLASQPGSNGGSNDTNNESSIAASGPVPSLSLAVDVTDRSSIAAGLKLTSQFASDNNSSIYGLVHAAAIGSGNFGFPFTNLSPDDWHRVLQVNVMGMVEMAHAVAPIVCGNGSGAMVFISSVAGQMGSQTDPPYSASKAANINFAQCMAKDLAGDGVRVNSVCPGMVQTPLNKSVWKAWHDRQPPEQRKSYEQWAGEKVRSVVPLGRWQTPQDIANMVVFLLSDRASEVTGQTINVDGGFVMHC